MRSARFSAGRQADLPVHEMFHQSGTEPAPIRAQRAIKPADRRKMPSPGQEKHAPGRQR